MCEGSLALFGGGLFAGDEAVGDGADDQSATTQAGGVHVKGRSLHLDGEDTHVLPAVVMRVLGIEDVRREHVTHLVAVAQAFAGVGGAAQQVEVGDGGVGAGQLILHGVVAVGA